MNKLLKPQVAYINFEKENTPMTILVKREKNRAKYIITSNQEEIKQGYINQVTLLTVLFEVARRNECLPYCNISNACSTYELRDANVQIALDPSQDGSWVVKIIYNDNRESETRHFPADMSQGNIINTLIPELGMPEPRYEQ